MRRLLGAALLLALLNTLAIVGILTLTSHRPNADAPFFDPGHCDQPCWHGIKIGVTTLREATTILENSPDFARPDRHPSMDCASSWIILASPFTVCFGSISNSRRV